MRTPFQAALAALILVAIPAPARSDFPPVYEVLFTHIEDTAPGGTLGSTQSRQNYLLYRNRLVSMGGLSHAAGVPWSLQPDWKFLLAALLYETDSLKATTNGKNLLRYLKEDLGVVIDPHSHENGYNYADVAHLLDSLGVGGSTVIGGHVWDPALPQFAEWDRFRVPVQGQHYPGAWWRGEILMGAGTPNHVNDPVVSGVWRPRDRYHYFQDDPSGNIVSIGHYTGVINDVRELHNLYVTGAVGPECMLTTSYPVKPSTLTRANGIQSVQDSVIAPIVALRDSGLVVATDFTSLVHTWQTTFASHPCVYDPYGIALAAAPAASPASVVRFGRAAPNPFREGLEIQFSVASGAHVRLSIYDIGGCLVARLRDGRVEAGTYSARWDARNPVSGLYFCTLEAWAGEGAPRPRPVTLKLVHVR